MDIYEILNEDITASSLLNDAKAVFERYAKNDNDGGVMVTSKSEALAYALSRMPATYEAVKFAAKKVLEICDAKFDSCVDVGAGTGSAAWAIAEALGITDCTCLEREEAMREVRRKADGCIVKTCKGKVAKIRRGSRRNSTARRLCGGVVHAKRTKT